MFLERLTRLNPALAQEAIRLHQAGDLLANTYLIDLDTISANSKIIATSAYEQGLKTYVMAKQYGRNPDVTRAAVSAGLGAVVCVDLTCLDAASRHRLPIGHVGHLVQPHRGAEHAIVATQPEVITLFNFETAARISDAAAHAGTTQDVLLRVHAPGDTFYFGHGGGFALNDIEDAAAAIGRLPGLNVTGVVTFPCLLANGKTRRIEPTPNLTTVAEAADRLRRAGYEITQVNTPGTVSSRVLPLLAAAGATHIEPGNAIHGTTPLHLLDDDAPERPAIVYVSEVSHVDGDDAYVFAAGFYIDKVLGDYSLTAIVGRGADALDAPLHVDTAPEGAIHYYCIVRDARRVGVRVGDTVVFGFRPQTFVARARTQAIAGIHSGGTTLLERFDQEANPVAGPF